jgi:hypothetical protein
MMGVCAFSSGWRGLESVLSKQRSLGPSTSRLRPLLCSSWQNTSINLNKLALPEMQTKRITHV